MKSRILDLLVDGPSSFAALLGHLRRRYATVAVEQIFALVEEMEARGWISVRLVLPDGRVVLPSLEQRQAAKERYRAWLDTATVSQVSPEQVAVDEVGLWCELQPDGLEKWRAWSGSVDSDPSDHWTLDDDRSEQSLVVLAATRPKAEELVQQWKERNTDFVIASEGVVIDTDILYRSKLGQPVKGVRIAAKYRKR